MSQKGINKAAKVFELMQEARGELMRMSIGNGITTMISKEGKQDAQLAQMLEDGKDAMKKRFCEITTSYRAPRRRRTVSKKKEL